MNSSKWAYSTGMNEWEVLWVIVITKLVLPSNISHLFFILIQNSPQTINQSLLICQFYKMAHNNLLNKIFYDSQSISSCSLQLLLSVEQLFGNFKFFREFFSFFVFCNIITSLRSWWPQKVKNKTLLNVEKKRIFNN